jgi:hypothetical protein
MRRFFLVTGIILWVAGLYFPSMATSAGPESGFVPRANYGARLEIADKVLQGAGQDIKGFANYFKTVGDSKPLIYKTYIGLKDDLPTFFAGLQGEMNLYLNQYQIYLIPEIGLYMTRDGHPDEHYEQDVAVGVYDEKIEQFCNLLLDLGHPAFIRIGFEFNGSWNGYRKDTYQKAYIRITNALRAHKTETATIWCAAHPLEGYMDYYPGDDCVDWWGIDLFSKEELTAKDTLAFLAKADTHGKPVMIPESTPQFVGVLRGQWSWNTWFKPYFNLIRTQKMIKAFCYINWNWANYPQWSDWGDARLEVNDIVAQNYRTEMSLPLYQPGMTEIALRQSLGYKDDKPPAKVSNVETRFDGCAVNLSWPAITGDTGVLRYEVFANGMLAGYSRGNIMADTSFKSGDQVAYTVRAVNSAGKTGPCSEPVVVKIPKTIVKIKNGEFDQGKNGWGIRLFEAGQGSFIVDDTARLSGKNSARIYVAHGTGTNWHVQFVQPFRSFQGKSYQVSFTAMADASTTLDICLQQTHDPYQLILFHSIDIGKKPKNFIFNNTTPAADDNLVLAFMVGKADRRTIWIDNVAVVEE